MRGIEITFECVLDFYFHFLDSRTHMLCVYCGVVVLTYHTFYKIKMFVSVAQDLQIIRHRPISHLFLLCLCTKQTFMYCNVTSYR